MNSTYLADFRRCRLESVSVEEYADLALRFMRKIVSNLLFWRTMDQLDRDIFSIWFEDPYLWGYYVTGFCEDLEAIISIIPTGGKTHNFQGNGELE